ncbi:hypothetical protein B0H16DRAFT_1630057 [Mycena metata]|uniref:Uncharacterized protein n=1 Tax=Mycena metata TaxID=1033252 RepID=A0AAD7H2D6_9AGAR|nr:hypothetical protein B0H16DRAFT_1630057 [Mycena metata]
MSAHTPPRSELHALLRQLQFLYFAWYGSSACCRTQSSASLTLKILTIIKSHLHRLVVRYPIPTRSYSHFAPNVRTGRAARMRPKPPGISFEKD